jgi:hypothetical protein
MGRRDHGKLAARHIATYRLNRNVAVAKKDAGQGFHLDIGHRRALRLRKAADLGLRETDILHVTGCNLLHRRLDLRSGQAKGWRVIAVEPYRQVAHSGIAAPVDIGQHRFDRGAGFRIIGGPFRIGFSVLQPGYCHVSPRDEYVCNMDKPRLHWMARRMLAPIRILDSALSVNLSYLNKSPIISVSWRRSVARLESRLCNRMQLWLKRCQTNIGHLA